MVRAKGPCYPVSEALYHLLGGKEAGWTPIQMRHEGVSHWALRHESGTIVDLTVGQFMEPPDYSKARGRGFLTKKPSKRAQKIIDAIMGAESFVDSVRAASKIVESWPMWKQYGSAVVIDPDGEPR